MSARGGEIRREENDGKSGAGKILVVATPIGNLSDLSKRAEEALRSADIVLAEDTRVTRRLLNHIGAGAKLLSLRRGNEKRMAEKILGRFAGGKGGKAPTIALVADAGTPAVSDPGTFFVRMAAGRGIRVEAIPGPSSVTAALSISGFDGSSFLFAGYPPRGRRDMSAFIEAAARERRTVILFETPHRLAATLEVMASMLGNRRIVVARELTKIHEEVFRGTAGEALNRFAEGARGEIVIVIEGVRECDESLETRGSSDAGDRFRSDSGDRFLSLLIERGIGSRTAAEIAAAALGISRNAAYRRIIALKSGTGS